MNAQEQESLRVKVARAEELQRRIDRYNAMLTGGGRTVQIHLGGYGTDFAFGSPVHCKLKAIITAELALVEAELEAL